MKTLKSLFFTSVIISISFNTIGQTIYHIDPNKTMAMLPDNSLKTNISSGRIDISNSNAQNINILLSDNNKIWDTTTVPAMQTLSYTTAIKYIKIYTSAEKFCSWKLSNGNSYAIFWNADEKKWDVK